jgi:hypothetical protein
MSCTLHVVLPHRQVDELVANVPHTDQCPTPVGSWRGSCAASSCTLSGMGKCILQCNCRTGAGKQRNAKCNLDKCSDLAVNRLGEFTCGGKVCPSN